MHRQFQRLLIVIVLFGLIFFLAFSAPVRPVQAQSETSFPAQINNFFTPNSIGAGSNSVFTITITNPNSFPLTLSTVPAALTDTLPAGVTFASPANPATTCAGSSITTIGTTLSIIGGTVPAKVGAVFGYCDVTVNVTSIIATTHINTIPVGAFKATDPTGTLNITNQTFSQSNLQVNSLQPPSLSKSFSSNTRWIGQTASLSITIRNNDLNYSLTNTSLTDTLPANIYIANSTVASNGNCGSYVVTGPGGSALAANDTSLTINNATILSNTSCVITVNATSSVAGVYLNTIPANAISTRQAVTNASAASAPINFQSIGMTKSFGVGNFQVGGSTTMSIVLQNPTTSPYTGVRFSDTLPSGLTYVSAAALQCNGGSIAILPGNQTLTLSNGTIPIINLGIPGSCTITATITGSIPGNFTNSIPPDSLRTDTLGVTNVIAATANITIYNTGGGILSPSKSFSPSTIAVGGTSVLAINVRAPADISLTNFSISDALPINVQVAATPNASKNASCQGGTWSPPAGATLLTYTGGTIPANQQCTLSVTVTSTTKGVFTNTISPANISNTEGRNTTSNFSANLTVSGLTVSKAFFPTTVNINGISTLTITLTNTNTDYLESVAFTDTLPAGLTIATPDNLRTTCGAGSVTTNVAARTITMSGGIIPAQVGSVPGVCTVDVEVIGLTTGAKNNSIAAGSPIGGVSGTIHGSGIIIYNPTAANATLTVASITISVVKGFEVPGTVFGGAASTLTVTLTNPTTAILVGIHFIDNLPQRPPDGGLSVANPAHASVGTCGGTLTAIPGNTSFEFSGGRLNPNSSCQLTVDIVTNVEDGLTNIINPGGVTTTNGAANPLEARATLNNLPGARVQKLFLQNPILNGGVSTLAITIYNESNFNLTGVGFLDTLPANMSLSGILDTSQCGGTVAYEVGTRRLTLTGASLLDTANCSIQIDVTTSLIGSYQNCIAAGALINDQGASNDEACDTLRVEPGVNPPSISKTFLTNPVVAGLTSPLRFTITNPNTTVALTGVSFSDNFPLGLVVSTPPNAAQCGGTVTITSNSVTLTGGLILANGSCTVTVGTKVDTGGVYPNVSDAVSSTNGGTGNTASSSLTVVSPPSISKAFNLDTITRGGTSTLTFTIVNPTENTVALTGVSFTDTLPTGLQIANPPNNPVPTGCGSPTFAPVAGASTLTFSGGTIAVNGTCVVALDVTAPNGGVYDNTSATVTSTNGGPGNTASSTLTVNGVGLALVKTTSTSNFKAAGDTITYNYQLTNTGTATLWAPFTVTDNMIVGPIDCGNLGTILSLASGESTTCSAPYTVTAGDVTTKAVTNVASALAQDAETGGSDVSSNTSTVTVHLARLTIDKTTTTTGYRAMNNRIDYTYTLTNTGNVNLYAPFMVSDDHFGSPLGTPFSCSSATVLPPSGVTTCTKSGAGNGYLVTQADLDAGLVTNTAFATASDAATSGATVTSSPDSVTVYRIIAPSISKTFSPDVMTVGETTTLTFTITNPNLVSSLTGVGFTDTFPVGITRVTDPSAAQCGGTVASTATSISLSNGFIIPGGTCDVSIIVTAMVPKLYPNVSGTVTSTNGGNGNTAADSLTMLGAPVITKSFSPDTIIEGGTSTVTITITNPTGNIMALTGVTFTDNFPTGLIVQDPPNFSTTNCGIPTYAPLANDTTLTFSSGTLVVGGSCVVTVDVTAPFGIYNNSTQPVTSANGGTGVKSNIATLSVNQAVDLTVTKTDGRIAVDSSEVTIYTIVVANAGPSAANGATFYDTFPSSLTGTTWTCIPDTGATCTASGIGNILDTVNIPSGMKVTYTVTATVAADATTDILNNASVVPPVGLVDLNESNNSSQDIDGLNGLTILKSITQTSFDTLGATINYSFTITNTGTSTLESPFTVVDNKATVVCTSLPGSIAPTESFTCTGTHSVTQGDLDAGLITNSVTATGHDGDEDTVTSNIAVRTLNAVQEPIIGISKRVVTVEEVSAGTFDVTMEFLVRNYGNVTLHDIDITDDLSETFPPTTTFAVQSVASTDLTVNPGFDGDSDINLLLPGDTLDVGQSKVVTLVVRVIPTSRGPYNNTAWAFGTSPDPAPGTPGLTVSDQSQNGMDPDPDNDLDPRDNNDVTPVDFGPRIFDPPFGIKTLNSSGVPILRWTMIWINETNIVSVHAVVHDPIPQNTTFTPDLIDSGYAVPVGAPAGSTSLGVSCTSSTGTVTILCYYEGPTLINPRGQVIWEGSLGPDFGVTRPEDAINAITITFGVTVVNSSVVSNTATIDSDLNGDGDALDVNLIDPSLNEINVALATYLWDVRLPNTGFAPNRYTYLPLQTTSYSDLGDLWLEIPRLGLKLPITGVPQADGKWDVTWLGNQAGWLNGTAFPTHAGNSVLTGHVYDAFGTPGPFVHLNWLWYGDKVIIHAWGAEYTYEVRQVKQVVPGAVASVLKHEDLPWVTLLTCRGYDDASDTYKYRVVVRAVLVDEK
jgi:LPXTG-site transpeptidase (sortase) family protein